MLLSLVRASGTYRLRLRMSELNPDSVGLHRELTLVLLSSIGVVEFVTLSSFLLPAIFVVNYKSVGIRWYVTLRLLTRWRTLLTVNSKMLDLSSTQQVIVEVPYSSVDPLKVNLGMCDGLLGNRIPEVANGSLDFYLSAPLVGPKTTTISTRVFILMQLCEDFDFAEVRVASLQDIASERGLIDTFVMQADRSDRGLTTGDVTEVTLLNVGLSRSLDVARELTSEVAPAPRALMQKFTFVCASGEDLDFQRFIAFYPLSFGKSVSWTNSATRSGQVPWSFLAHYAVMFAGVRGSIRIKAFMNDPRGLQNDGVPFLASFPVYGSVCKTSSGELTITGSYPPMHGVVQSFSDTTGVEMSFPYSCQRKYYNPRIASAFDSSATNNERTICIKSGISQDYGLAGPNANWFLAGGDDFTVTRYRRVPALFAAGIVPEL